jgi:hypothetical protein
MKFALACDSSKVDSYFCKDNKVYLYDGQPYYRMHHVSNECLMGFWNYPLLFDGYFINLTDGKFPDEDFDIIFAAIESDINNLHVLKNVYPNALILGTQKEPIVQKNIRNYLIDNTAGFVSPYLTFDYFKEYGYITPAALYTIPQPVNINYLRSNFLENKNDTIFNYANYWAGGRYNTNSDFIQLLNLDVINGRSDIWEQFIRMWNKSKYLLNLDTSLNFGQQATQCAALGTIMIGGNNDANKILYPELATCNLTELASKFNKLTNDIDYYNFTVQYAFTKVNEIYSFETIKNQIQSIL